MFKHTQTDFLKLKKFKTSFTLLALALAVQNAYANRPLIDNIWYRDYLDFGQNKGIFKPGATNVEIVRKDGTKFKLPDVPIPDFSALSSKGVTTSIGGAYTVTASHNENNFMQNGKPVHHAIAQQVWGNTTYQWVGSKQNGDFAVERLNKFVVETEGFDGGVTAPQNQAGWNEMMNRYGVDVDGKRKVIIYRAGTGSAFLRKDNQTVDLGVGFEPTLVTGSVFELEKWNHAWSNQTYKDFINPTTAGDSGTALLVYDNIDKKWVVLGTLLGIDQLERALYNPWHEASVQALKDQYTAKVQLNGQTGTFTANNQLTVDGQTTQFSQKDLSLSGGGCS